MFRFLAWISVSIILFSLAIGGIRVFASQGESIAQRILGPNSTAKPQACWYDICPDRTSLTDSTAFLNTFARKNDGVFLRKPVIFGPVAGMINQLPYTDCTALQHPIWLICGIFFDDWTTKIPTVEIDASDTNLRLSDIIKLLGNPDGVVLCEDPYYHIPYDVKIIAYYTNGIEVEAQQTIYPDSDFFEKGTFLSDSIPINPGMQIKIVDILAAPIDKTVLPPNATAWQGFRAVRIRKYYC